MNSPPVTMARYGDTREAMHALGQLMEALAGGQTHFDMPESLLFCSQQTIHDKRVKRKGGS